MSISDLTNLYPGGLPIDPGPQWPWPPADQLRRHADPFAPDWSTAPDWAEYHTIDADAQGVWWRNAGIVLGTTAWYHDAETTQRHAPDTHTYDLTGLDWRNSLRARPAAHNCGNTHHATSD